MTSLTSHAWVRRGICAVVSAAALAWASGADANLVAGVYPCATVTISASGQITAITANQCPSPKIWLHSGGYIFIHSGGLLACHSC